MEIKNHSVLPMSKKFLRLLTRELKAGGVDPKHGIILNFRDPKYSAEAGGFHPVEVAVSEEGKILYVTDFSFSGTAPFCDLSKELDWDIGVGIFEHMQRVYPLNQGRSMFQIWAKNFCHYHSLGTYDVSVTSLVG